MFGRGKNKTTTKNVKDMTLEERELIVREGVLIMDILTKHFEPKQAGAIMTAFLLIKDSNLTVATLKYALDEYLENSKPIASNEEGGDE